MFKNHASRVGLSALSALAAALALVVTAAPASSAPPGNGGHGGGGGGGGGSGPTGRIYFITDAANQYQNYTWSMNADGSDAGNIGSWGYKAVPSRNRHADHTYFLTNRPIPGAYLSDGTTPQWELFAIRNDFVAGNNETSETKVQLTDDADVQPLFPAEDGACWFDGDSRISFVAKRWGGSSFVDGGIWTAEVSFDASGAVVGLVAPATRVLTCPLGAYGLPTVFSHTWGPNAAEVAYIDSSAPGLWVADLNAGTRTQISSEPASYPSWAPDGSKIAFSAGGSIWAVKPDGTSQRRLQKPVYLNTTNWRAFSHPRYSPDSAYIVCTGYPSQGWTDLFMITASGNGSSLTNVTQSDTIGEISTAWCEE